MLKILDDSIKKMNDEEKKTMEKELKTHGVKNVDLSAGVPLAVVLVQAGVNFSGFLAYRMAVIVANAVAKAVLGQGLKFATNAALTRAIGILAGPIGWVITGLWTLVDIAGPAYRVTIPCVVHIAYLRQKKQFEQLGEEV